MTPGHEVWFNVPFVPKMMEVGWSCGTCTHVHSAADHARMNQVASWVSTEGMYNV